MKRIVSVWLPFLTTDRLCRQGFAAPFNPTDLLASADQRRLVAVNAAARVAGLRPGQSIAEARALAPELRLAAHDPAADRALLDRLVDWCGRYTPWCAIDETADRANGAAGEGGGVWLDITGAAHLLGGEAALLADLENRLWRAGCVSRLALADTPGAAWAWARYGFADQPCLPPGRHRDSLAGLPVDALRLPAATAAGLRRLGLKTIGMLYGLPRAGLVSRFGSIVALRLDQALGRQDEPISPVRPPPAILRRMRFVEPIVGRADLILAVRHLLGLLCEDLERGHLGLRRLGLAAFRLDASVARLGIGTLRPNRDPAHLLRLLQEPLTGLDAGFGIEMLHLEAVVTEPLAAQQLSTDGGGATERDAVVLAALLDSLGNRLGGARVYQLAPRQSHLPERSVQRLPVSSPPRGLDGGGGGWTAADRPVLLFSSPERIEAVAPLPDAPPLLFRWRRQSHRIVHAEGPERLAAEWWRRAGADRDYYRVEDDGGHRFWLYREGVYGDGPTPLWFLHGIFS